MSAWRQFVWFGQDGRQERSRGTWDSATPRGIDFLGYVLLPHAQLVRTKTRRRIIKKIGERVRDFKNEKISEETLLQLINSYFGVLGHANSYKLQQHIKHLVWSLLLSPDGS